MMSSPIVRPPVPCGYHSVEYGREATQNGWYCWIGSRENGKTVLDVGCGLGDGLKQLRMAGVDSATGIDQDPRLLHGDSRILVGDFMALPDDSFDVVTAVDVIEHVVADERFVSHLLRIAGMAVYITTPNFNCSKCGNSCHCREYAIPFFWRHFRPDEIWCASPDGWLGHTRVLSGADSVSDAQQFLHEDGGEWPHFCAHWRFGGD